MQLVMFSKDKEARAGVIDGEDIIDINANDRSLPPSIKGILEATGLARVRKLLKSKKHRTPRARAKLLPNCASMAPKPAWCWSIWAHLRVRRI